MKKNKENNIVHAEISELEKSGYRAAKVKFDKKNNVIPPEPNSLLCLNNKDKNLWAELSPADIKISKVSADKFLILEKK